MARIILISFEQKISDKNLDVFFETESDSIFVSADKDAIHQVMYNLMHNAIKFSKDGGKLAQNIRAAALGDIGKLFPDNDPAYKGADSLLLTRRVAAVLHERGYRIGNVDATVIAQAPKLAPHIDTMRENLSKALQIPKDRIGVKATTEERLGFTGEKLGISSHAVCLLIKESI